ncbi:hypothetical protein EUGRSUZ_H01979 [Eucalyptus grandis]|uniref:Uncharacterized protein n=2 Tax=Eucalyptus grandis TaxID=71139 RepID=A0ACC3JPK2_EUCGR|nr:hypothetical protein EUGRSUZ_H01979 [Eucalyptus grandis]
MQLYNLPLMLTSMNYPSWSAQINSLLLGYNLMGYVDGTILCSSNTITIYGKAIVNPSYSHWVHRDQLLLHAIIASTSNSIVPPIASTKTPHEAWNLFANKTHCMSSISRSI